MRARDNLSFLTTSIAKSQSSIAAARARGRDGRANCITEQNTCLPGPAKTRADAPVDATSHKKNTRASIMFLTFYPMYWPDMLSSYNFLFVKCNHEICWRIFGVFSASGRSYEVVRSPRLQKKTWLGRNRPTAGALLLGPREPLIHTTRVQRSPPHDLWASHHFVNTSLGVCVTHHMWAGPSIRLARGRIERFISRDNGPWADLQVHFEHALGSVYYKVFFAIFLFLCIFLCTVHDYTFPFSRYLWRSTTTVHTFIYFSCNYVVGRWI